MKIDQLINNYEKGGKGQCRPPSEVILKNLVNNKYVMTDDKSKKLAEKVLLANGEVKLWCEHLQTVYENRIKGALARKKKKSRPK